MRAVLVVEPRFCDFQTVLNRLPYDCVVLYVPDPLAAVQALQALVFDIVVVPSARVDEFAYSTLFSAMRLIAPGSKLQCALPGTRDPARRVEEGMPEAPGGMFIRLMRQREVARSL